MADICVILSSKDERIVFKLVTLLRKQWEVWWYQDTTHGDWESEERKQIKKAKAVVAVVTSASRVNPKFKDELDFSEEKGKLVYQFIIDNTKKIELPFGHGHKVFTTARKWNGEDIHPGYKELIRKISDKLPPTKKYNKNLGRPEYIQINSKTIKLPSFIFSLSSHETQLRPKDGIALFQFLEPASALISAYDVYEKYPLHIPNGKIRKLIRSSTVVFLDSGNYEASRKKDYQSKQNKNGWNRDRFREVVNELSPDIVFSYDKPDPKGEPKSIIKSIINNYHSDKRAIKADNISVVPIVHLPNNLKGNISECASYIIKAVAKELDPIMIAIPERELGDGLNKRFITVRNIRKELNRLGKYYPLHLLGTGNPITMSALAVAGADTFDGLEWCRTTVDPEKGHLFHFQHYDCFKDIRTAEMGTVRRLIENPKTPYILRVVSFNFDYYNEFSKEMQSMIHSGQKNILLKNVVPHISAILIKELEKRGK